MGASFGLLALHGIVEAGEVDADAAVAQRILREVEREAVGVVELEGRLAVKAVALRKIGRRLRQQAQSALQRLAETGFLELQRLGNKRFGAREFRIGPTHLLHQHWQELVDDGLTGTEKLRMAHGAAHDAAEHVAATLVRGQHPVCDQEGGRTEMVGDDAVAGTTLTLGLNPGQLHRSLDQRPK